MSLHNEIQRKEAVTPQAIPFPGAQILQFLPPSASTVGTQSNASVSRPRALHAICSPSFKTRPRGRPHRLDNPLDIEQIHGNDGRRHTRRTVNSGALNANIHRDNRWHLQPPIRFGAKQIGGEGTKPPGPQDALTKASWCSSADSFGPQS